MISHFAKREWLEQRRHPAMLGICAALLVLVTTVVLAALLTLQWIHGSPEAMVALAELTDLPAEATVVQASGLALQAFGFLVHSQYLGFVGVIAGHAILHDRERGTLPFLLLAPVRRHELLAGKVLGALGPITLVFWAVGALGGAIVALLPVSAIDPAHSPLHASWWVALLAAGPAWAAFVATGAAVISALARDVRLAQQGVWFLVFFVQLAVAFLITGALGSLSAQLVALALGMLAAGGAQVVGIQVLNTDLAR